MRARGVVVLTLASDARGQLRRSAHAAAAQPNDAIRNVAGRATLLSSLDAKRTRSAQGDFAQHMMYFEAEFRAICLRHQNRVRQVLAAAIAVLMFPNLATNR